MKPWNLQVNEWNRKGNHPELGSLDAERQIGYVSA